jgi:hypothetical protein
VDVVVENYMGSNPLKYYIHKKTIEANKYANPPKNK